MTTSVHSARCLVAPQKTTVAAPDPKVQEVQDFFKTIESKP